MRGRTIYVFPKGRKWGVGRDSDDKRDEVRFYETKQAAIDAARLTVKGLPIRHVVVLERAGSIKVVERYGLPEIQRSRRKSTLGRKVIDQAISSVILKRLVAE